LVASTKRYKAKAISENQKALAQ
jgi:hypothetical protein